MGSTDKFFEQKHEWSKIKDRILGAYLTPYLSKISHTGKGVRIGDCFAGKGRFDDGEDGSPIIILNAITRQLAHTPAASIHGVFIEKKYVEDLRRNLPEGENIHILEGGYEDRVENFIRQYNARHKNLFLYVDPYGIKSIRMEQFRAVAEMPFNTVEMLINFNAHGFLREGCRLLKGQATAGDAPGEFYEEDVDSDTYLDEIAGGRYWRDVIEEYYRTEDLNAAEMGLANGYRDELSKVFDYVLQFPVKRQLDHIAKYRMIYCTNHEDGYLLMADNMAKRWKEFRDAVRDQPLLFEMDFPEAVAQVGVEAIEKELVGILETKTALKAVLLKLIRTFGVSFSIPELKDAAKKLAGDGTIVVTRTPDTYASGQSIRGWDEASRDYQVYLERNAQWQQTLL